MSDPVIVGSIVTGIGVAAAAVIAARSARGNTLVTGQASFIDDYREELVRVRADFEAERRTLLAQLAEARAEVARLKSEAAARCVGDLIVDNAIGDTP